MEKYITKDRIQEALVVIKYLFSVYVTLMAFQTRHSRLYLICHLLDLAGMIGISNLILMKNRWIGHGVHFLLLLKPDHARKCGVHQGSAGEISIIKTADHTGI